MEHQARTTRPTDGTDASLRRSDVRKSHSARSYAHGIARGDRPVRSMVRPHESPPRRNARAHQLYTSSVGI